MSKKPNHVTRADIMGVVIGVQWACLGNMAYWKSEELFRLDRLKVAMEKPGGATENDLRLDGERRWASAGILIKLADEIDDALNAFEAIMAARTVESWLEEEYAGWAPGNRAQAEKYRAMAIKAREGLTEPAPKPIYVPAAKAVSVQPDPRRELLDKRAAVRAEARRAL